ncbi:MAG TPA: hypothetical protein VG013_38060 [Gemmataceae bacterium]|jgi:hypothetical protein|nr:hypothetical protein [Gemmataceae bacterium]
MKHARWPAAVLAVLWWGTELRAQLFFTGPFGDGDAIMGRAFGLGRHGRHFSYSASLFGSYPLGLYPLYPSWAGPSNQIIVLYSQPQQVVVSQPPMLGRGLETMPQQEGPAQPEDDPNMLVIKPRQGEPLSDRDLRKKGIFAPEQRRVEAAPRAAVPEERPLRGEPASVFRKVGPADRKRAQEPMLPAPAEPVPGKPAAPGKLPPAPAPAELPKDPFARQIALAKQAFAARLYGLAERRFREAVRMDPDEALPHFLLAQAEFALGKYQQAVDAIHAGMRLRPDWPDADFRPAELYAANADDFDEQRKRLEDALTENPRDPVLLFLLGYELWFDGRQKDALRYFQRAAAVAPDKTFINHFLKGKPKAAVVKK